MTHLKEGPGEKYITFKHFYFKLNLPLIIIPSVVKTEMSTTMENSNN